MFSSIQKIINTDIPEDEQEKLNKIVKPISLKKGQYFLKAGEVSKNIAFLVSGLLRFFFIDLDGSDVTKYFCFENSVILTSAALSGRESVYYIEALEDCVLITADYPSFAELTNHNTFWLEIVKNEYEK
ncbi:MAG: Crp/Fnr family transcriptional regulator, partial [Firmicutes bacterium]|nr:Crp/Fnr family transcriptional regulator [Bacillota bacterium]